LGGPRGRARSGPSFLSYKLQFYQFLTFFFASGPFYLLSDSMISEFLVEAATGGDTAS